MVSAGISSSCQNMSAHFRVWDFWLSKASSLKAWNYSHWRFLQTHLYKLWAQLNLNVSFENYSPKGIVEYRQTCFKFIHVSAKNPKLVSVTKLFNIKGVPHNPHFHAPLSKSVPIHFPKFRNKLISLETMIGCIRCLFVVCFDQRDSSFSTFDVKTVWFEMGA